MCFYIDNVIIVTECVLYSNPSVNSSNNVNTAILLGAAEPEQQPNFPSRDLVPTPARPTTSTTITATTTTIVTTLTTTSTTQKPKPNSPVPVRSKSPSKKDFLEVIRNFKRNSSSQHSATIGVSINVSTALPTAISLSTTTPGRKYFLDIIRNRGKKSTTSTTTTTTTSTTTTTTTTTMTTTTIMTIKTTTTTTTTTRRKTTTTTTTTSPTPRQQRRTTLDIFPARATSNKLGGLKGKSLSPANVIVKIMNHLHISNPIVLEFDEISKTSEIMEFYKAICKNSNFINFNTPFNSRDDSYVIFTKIQNFRTEIQTDNVVLVVSDIDSEKELQQIEVSIGTEIYFLDWDSLKIYETYQINGARITRYLGQFVIERSKNVFFKGADGNFSIFFSKM